MFSMPQDLLERDALASYDKENGTNRQRFRQNQFMKFNKMTPERV
jgi:hypothetical protein